MLLTTIHVGCMVALARDHTQAMCSNDAMPRALADVWRVTFSGATALGVLRLVAALCDASAASGTDMVRRTFDVIGVTPLDVASLNASGVASLSPRRQSDPLSRPARRSDKYRPLYHSLALRGAPTEAKALSLEVINVMLANQATLEHAVALRSAFMKLGLFKSRARLRAECASVLDDGDDALSSSSSSSSSSSPNDDQSSSSESSSSTSAASNPKPRRRASSSHVKRWARRLVAALDAFDKSSSKDEYELLHVSFVWFFFFFLSTSISQS
jgi:hypothetical protein